MSEFLFLIITEKQNYVYIFTQLRFRLQKYNIIFTQKKSRRNFNRSLTILGGEVVGGASCTGDNGSGGAVGGASRTGDNGSSGSGGSGGGG